MHKLQAENMRNCPSRTIKMHQETNFSSSNISFSDLNAFKDDSKHKAIISTKEIKKRKIANRIETSLEEISLLLLPVKHYILDIILLTIIQ